ncbi:Hypothetical predicted protein [Mytilus galloprovincialis]|uniref:Fibrinogen C-terminal domain-containing protein n=1 Tax=Mytilus galloprovincialis TaxID=29158 RepID=A0A8B6HHE1_MYTGA|nr:Hypothetical predicted protein [Mytilus galloprovincialis]
MEDFENNRKYALYDKFSVGSESSGYVLDVGGYSGDAGDGLGIQNGQKFSTKERITINGEKHAQWNSREVGGTMHVTTAI